VFFYILTVVDVFSLPLSFFHHWDPYGRPFFFDCFAKHV